MSFKKGKMNRRQALELGLKITSVATLSTVLPVSLYAEQYKAPDLIFDVHTYGAVGNGIALDTRAIQKAVDDASMAKNNAKVVLRAGFKYLIGTIELKSNIIFHLEGNAELLVSTNKDDYTGEAAIIAKGAQHLTISGTGSINGRALEFMSHYEEANEWWIPKAWRPKLFILTSCTNLLIQDIAINKAPSWSLHMLGCENVLIDTIKINNNLDVPNCDGIDPDHCRNVEIKNCHIICGDDAIVIKTTRQTEDFGPSANIRVRDCILETQDSGVKIGTETTQDIYNVSFERCKITTSCRGITIQLRDEGRVHDVTFKDIDFVARYHSDPWWGRGEAISLTAIPRNPEVKCGSIDRILIKNITGRAENSVRINGCKESRISNVKLDNVHIELDRWTAYKGRLFDNRPTTVYPGIEQHSTPGYYIRFADHVELKNCSIKWGANIPDYFSNALEAHDVSALKLKNFKGKSAHPARDKDISIV